MTDRLILYDYELSGNCHKVRMLLAFLRLAYEKVRVDITGKEPEPPEFAALSPRRQVPVLVDGGDALWDSTAILVYLARRYGGEGWLPSDALGEARVMQWLALAQNEILYGLARARAVFRLKRPWNLAECHTLGNTALRALEQRLAVSDWLAADHVTIADVACYPYVGLAGEGQIALAPYPAVQRWMGRIRALEGYVSMPGL